MEIVEKSTGINNRAKPQAEEARRDRTAIVLDRRSYLCGAAVYGVLFIGEREHASPVLFGVNCRGPIGTAPPPIEPCTMKCLCFENPEP